MGEGQEGAAEGEAGWQQLIGSGAAAHSRDRATQTLLYGKPSAMTARPSSPRFSPAKETVALLWSLRGFGARIWLPRPVDQGTTQTKSRTAVDSLVDEALEPLPGLLLVLQALLGLLGLAQCPA